MITALVNYPENKATVKSPCDHIHVLLEKHTQETELRGHLATYKPAGQTPPTATLCSSTDPKVHNTLVFATLLGKTILSLISMKFLEWKCFSFRHKTKCHDISSIHLS